MNKEQLRQEENSKKREVLFFDPGKEVEFLKKVDADKKYLALGQELKTAMQELFWVQGGVRDRVWDGNRIKDAEFNTFLDGLSNNELDRTAFEKIQKSLGEGNNLVVHLSPMNVELGNNFNVVDFWLNDKESKKLKYVRIIVNEGFERMKKIYETFGGKEKIESNSDLVLNPLAANEFRMADFMANLTQVDKRIDTTKERIDEVVDKLMRKFYRNFGNKIYLRTDLIDRLFSAVYDVVLNGERLDDEEVEVYITNMAEDFMYARILDMRVRKVEGVCPGVVRTAEFGSGKPMMVTMEGGSLVFKEVDNTDGLRECKACGFWYSGEKCPLCN